MPAQMKHLVRIAETFKVSKNQEKRGVKAPRERLVPATSAAGTRMFPKSTAASALKSFRMAASVPPPPPRTFFMTPLTFF